MITQEELQKVLHYDQDTGIFTRLIANGRKFKVGDVAGCVCSQGYAHIQIGDISYMAHRLAYLYMTGGFPEETDHVNHTKDDNRWLNLREVTRQENAKNRPMNANNKSGFTGVLWHKRDRKLAAQIKRKHIGYFSSLSDAVFARLEAEEKYLFHPNHGAQS